MIFKLKLFLFLLLFQTVLYSQNTVTEHSNFGEENYFISMNIGSQMSGIKDEDFISSNYSPLINVFVGKWLNKYIAIQMCYKGVYFNAIADEIKHHYNYFYSEVVINFNNIVSPNRTNRNWNLLLHSGAGYFYNSVYEKPNFCANLGIMNNYQITNNLQVNLDVAAIVGWDIYQGNKDILPGVTVGVNYLFVFN